MKKALKIISSVLLIVFVLLLVIPFAFQSQIQEMVKRFINENLNAKVEFKDVSLSLIKSFPSAHVEVDDLLITNFEPFEGETFASAKRLAFTMSVKELFKTADEDPIVVNSISLSEALLNLKTDDSGNNNYDITKETPEEINKSKTESSAFSFSIEDYTIENSALNYSDDTSNIRVKLTDLNHAGRGIFSTETSELDTHTDTRISVVMDSTKYLSNNSIILDALIGMDLNDQKYTFKKNKAYINKLPLEFDGFVRLIENGQEIDITFENPESSFKDFLAIIPESYSKNIESVETTGDFKVNGLVKGTLSDERIPKLDINISSNNAAFKYPDLPKRVDNININASVKNETGLSEDTYVQIDNLDFKIDEDVFRSSASINNLTDNKFVNANIDGVLNLGNITKAYPIEFDKNLSGILETKLNTQFDLNAIETNAYNRIKNNGKASISDFVFSSEDIVNPIQISNADLTFKPGNVSLNSFKAQTGTTDLSATGTITNLLGFLLSDKNLQGDFKVNSNQFIVSDFMVEDSSASKESNKTTTKDESLKIPEFLDCTIQADAKTVLYDGLTLKNVKGKLIIKDQEAELQNMSSSLFDGDLYILGKVSTKEDVPKFNLDLRAEAFDIAQSFRGFDLLQNLAPIAEAMKGKLNTVFQLNGTLDSEFSPNLDSMSGAALAILQTTEIQPKEGSVLNQLENSLNFVDFSKLNLKDLKANLKFSDGKVNVEPFKLGYEDIGITVSGSHSFDKTLNYEAVFDVPAKYLGSDVNRLINKIDDPKVKKITIPVTANISGTHLKPKVKTDLSSGISNLTKQLIEIEKEKLLDQGTEQVKGILDDLLGGSSKSKDSSTTENETPKNDPLQEGVKNVLNDLFGKKKKEQDSTKNN